MDNTISQTQSPFATEPIGRLIAKFAIPSVIALLVNSLYNIVDQIFIGWGVGYLGNGATNVVFPITIIALALSMMIGNGGAAYLSLKLGEGEVPAAKRGVGNAVSLAVIVSIVLAAVFLLCIDPILTLFGATDILRPYALEYGYIIGIGLPFMMISASINSMIRADGSPKYAMFSMVIGAILNVILDPVLIFIFEMGVQGKTRLLPSAVNLAAAAEPSEKRWQRSWGCPAMTKSWSKRSQPRAALAKPTFRKPGNMRRADFCRLRFPTMTRDPILRTCSGRSNTKPSESWPRRDPA